MLTVHVEHGTHHLQLPFGIHQRKKLMHITVSIPKGEYGIPVALCRKNPVAFHCRILPVDVLQKVGMYQRMIKRRIENNLLLVRPAFHNDTRQIVVQRLRLSANTLSKSLPDCSLSRLRRAFSILTKETPICTSICSLSPVSNVEKRRYHRPPVPCDNRYTIYTCHCPDPIRPPRLSWSAVFSNNRF